MWVWVWVCDVAAGLTWVKCTQAGRKGAAHEERQAAFHCALVPLPVRERGHSEVAPCGLVPSLFPFNSKWFEG